jgi:hypothetical protein
MNRLHRRDLAHYLVLPTLLFAAIGGMVWAVRGCSGYGAVAGCTFAGVTWGAAWWYISRDPGPVQSRRYSSGWIVLALTVGIGISGARGWMQWPSFFEGHLLTNYSKGEWVPISPAYGFVWLFIAGVPWAGLGACMLAWCGSRDRTSPLQWVLRIACGIGGAWLAVILFRSFPEVFLPLYKSMKAQYADLETNPNLRRLIGDNRSAMMHLGLYLGFLSYEALRRDWKNVLLIVTVGVVNGFGWALCQNWKWAAWVWPGADFNFWRCWESSGGISIGIAYGVAYFLVNRPESGTHVAERSNLRPNLERFGLYLGLLLGLSSSIRSGLKGWANIYIGNEDYWNGIFGGIIRPLTLVCIVAVAIWIWRRPLPKPYAGNLFPYAYRLMWTVLIIQNILAQLVTGPPTAWNEVVFSIYYVLLFAVTGTIVFHYHFRNRHEPFREPG